MKFNKFTFFAMPVVPLSLLFAADVDVDSRQMALRQSLSFIESSLEETEISRLVLEITKTLRESIDNYAFSREFQTTDRSKLLDNFCLLSVMLKDHFHEANQPWNTPSTLWGTLAGTYLEIALLCANSHQQVAEIKLFSKEVSSYSNNSQTTYTWFLIFLDRLSIVMTEPGKRPKEEQKKCFNTKFDAYKVRCIIGPQGKEEDSQPIWHSYDGYVNHCQSVACEITKENYSVLALSKLFPFIVILPFPFELSATDLVLTMPDNESSNLWLAGLPLTPIFADGYLMEPWQFFSHDLQHLCIWHWRITNFCFFINYDGKSYNQVPPELIRHYMRSWRKLFFSLQNIFREIILNTHEDPQLQRMNEFFSFWLLHENTTKLDAFLRNLHFLPNTDLHQFIELKLFKNENYYTPLLPDSIVQIEEELEFKDAIVDHLKMFLRRVMTEIRKDENLFCLYDSIMDSHKLLNSSDTESSLYLTAFSFGQNGYFSAWETELMRQDYENDTVPRLHLFSFDNMIAGLKAGGDPNSLAVRSQWMEIFVDKNPFFISRKNPMPWQAYVFNEYYFTNLAPEDK